MTEPLGLSTYRWNNNLKSMALLAAFPLLLLALLAAFFGAAGYFSLLPDGHVSPALTMALGLTPASYDAATLRLTPAQMALEGVVAWWPAALGVAGLWVLIGYFFNGAMIRAATGARAVTRQEEPALYNTLETLCIERGLAMPALYVMETDAMNAFASGVDQASFAVTVTRGLLNRLNERELSAVLAHELTHILNRDVRLLIVTVVFTGMLSFLGQLLWRNARLAAMYGSSREDARDGERRNPGALMLLAAVLMAVGYGIAVLMRLALSRKREYLADAGSVALTKDPQALISALEKISGNAAVPDVPSEVRQMFIENPPSLAGWFATHPPLEDRIDVLRRLGGLPEAGQSVIPRAQA